MRRYHICIYAGLLPVHFTCGSIISKFLCQTGGGPWSLETWGEFKFFVPMCLTTFVEAEWVQTSTFHTKSLIPWPALFFLHKKLWNILYKKKPHIYFSKIISQKWYERWSWKEFRKLNWIKVMYMLYFMVVGLST